MKEGKGREEQRKKKKDFEARALEEKRERNSEITGKWSSLGILSTKKHKNRTKQKRQGLRQQHQQQQ